jgi:leucyl/phenylalanyl-tRNA--protein transferase
MICWIDPDSPPDTPFPPLDAALAEPNGLLAAGADLSPTRLLQAYRQGVFPWFSEGQPILWWSPDPRMVLYPTDFRLRRSLHQALKRDDYQVQLDSDFAAVLHACASTPRRHQSGTWITEAMQSAYLALHAAGYAHSVEVWRQGQLIGGLYGVALGGLFYGESMFSQARDASKIAFAHLARFWQQQTGGSGLIDCQMHTAHLESLGARLIPRADFAAAVQHLASTDACGHWRQDAACVNWRDIVTLSTVDTGHV